MRVIRRFVVAGAAVAGLALAPGAGAAPVSVGHSGWVWGNPTPQGRALAAVTFDGATGYAVGDFGTALKSTDGGMTWTGLPSGTYDDLTLVQELDPNTIVVGGGCTVAESTDGGASFTQLPISTSANCDDPVTAVGFTSPSNGFIQQQGGEISFTDNGGQTVQAKTPVPVGDGASAEGLQFVSPTTGFSVGGGRTSGSIERTTDGASSWTTVGSATHRLNALTFVNATTAFAVGDEDTLLESTDGGATWTPRPLALPAGTAALDLKHISCSDTSNCLISPFGSRSLIRTTDGGMTGTLVTPSAQTLADVAFSTGTNVIAVGDNGETVLSNDGGATFPTAVSSDPAVYVSGYAPNGLRAGGTAGSAYLLGMSGLIEATANGGASWTTERVPGGGNLIDGAFPTTTTGFVITSDSVLRKTVDGGTSWSSLEAGVGNTTALAATSPTNVLLLGPKGIRRSTDGGQTFTKVGGAVTVAVTAHKSRKGPRVSSLALSRSLTVGHTVFAWSTKAGYESTDGGTKWRSIPFPAKTEVEDLSFVSPSTGYVLDLAGDILFTRNAGRTWTKLPGLGTQRALRISFSSARDGFAVLPTDAFPNGFPADLLATTNGGKTWAPQVITDDDDEQVLATPGHDYFEDPANPAGNPNTSAVLSTSNGGASPHPSTLTISIGPKRLTAKALTRTHHSRVTVKGTLSPVSGDGTKVVLAFRRPAGHWSNQLVKVASNGRFQVTIKNIRATTDFVVYANGDDLHGGAGAYARLLVR